MGCVGGAVLMQHPIHYSKPNTNFLFSALSIIISISLLITDLMIHHYFSNAHQLFLLHVAYIMSWYGGGVMV